MRGMDYWSKFEKLARDAFDSSVKELKKLYEQRKEPSVDVDNLLKSQSFAEDYETKISNIIEGKLR